jgi:hypothetical protein
MIDQTFWRDLETRFRKLHDEQLRSGRKDALYAQWKSTLDDTKPWYLAGGPKDIHKRFEWFAESAAVRMGHAAGASAVFFWLDLLKGESPNYHPVNSSHIEKGDKETRWEGGTIECVCEASADYCLKCETQEKGEARKLESRQSFSHSDDYTSVTTPNGAKFTLTKAQGAVIAILHDAFKSGNPNVSNTKILETLERETSRLQDIFKSSPGGWKALIKSTRRGVYRLNLPDPSDSRS